MNKYTEIHRRSQKVYKLSEKGMITQAKYYRSEAKRESSKRWRANPRNKEKISAHRKVYSAIKAGNIKKEACSLCGEKRTFAHHDDYSKPLSVRWLCQKHHSEYHRNNN